MPDPATLEVSRHGAAALARFTRSKTERERHTHQDRWQHLADSYPPLGLALAVLDDPRTDDAALLGLMHLHRYARALTAPVWGHPNATTLTRAHLACNTAKFHELADTLEDGPLFEWILDLFGYVHRPLGPPLPADPLQIRARWKTVMARARSPYEVRQANEKTVALVHADLTHLLAPLPPPARALAITLGHASPQTDPQAIIAAAQAASA